MPKTAHVIAGIIIALVIVSAAAGIYVFGRSPSATTRCTTSPTTATNSTTPIQVVAGENFWGSLVAQLGGIHANVTSIVTDPNTDPHEYESNACDALLITKAQFIIVNGAGYDTWALDMLSAENTPNQVVLNVQELLKQPITANPHFWYSPYYVNTTVHAMYKNLISIEPAYTAYFRQQYADLNVSLYQDYMKEEAIIKQTFGGAPVASTESIFVYMANATGLNLVSPPGFMEAVAEGTDPSAQDVAAMENLMMGGNSTVRVLIYNKQTVTPLTQTIKSLAGQNQIPILGVTETIQPPGITFQVWMQSEVDALYNCLNAATLGQ